MELNIPNHIAIIMDGNRRWARFKNLIKSQGHKEGVRALENICNASIKYGVKVLTVYAFSNENWKRDEEEISSIMSLLESYLFSNDIDKLINNGIYINFIGDLTKFNQKILLGLDRVKTESNKIKDIKLHLNIAINYSGKTEIVKACQTLIDLNLPINIENIEKNLYTKDFENPDLLIRTGGYQRISNFLIWQIAYTEIYFSNILWPDFNENNLREAIEFFSIQKRNFGS